MISFQIKLNADKTMWIPDHPELEGKMAGSNKPGQKQSEVRNVLFQMAERLSPGVYTLDYDLEQLRKDAFTTIDKRSDEIIAAGFTYQEIVFSCSVNAQVRYSVMLTNADALAPLEINSLDDQAKVVLPYADDIRRFCNTALDHVRSVVDSGTTVKDTVRAATAEELVDFVDPR